jgi:uncharacterized protein YneF (UPF0154 family)
VKNALLVLVGLFAGLWLSERQRSERLERRVATEPPRKDRTLEEMSAAYGANRHPAKDLVGIVEDQFPDYVHQLAAELVQPNMTPLEAKRVADYLGSALVSARGYEFFRELLKDNQSEKWLHQAMDVEENNDDGIPS